MQRILGGATGRFFAISPFECLSIIICSALNIFLLILLFLRLKYKQSNSQSINVFAEIFAGTLLVTRAFLAKLNFPCSSKIFSDPCKILFCLRKTIFPVREKFLKSTAAFSQKLAINTMDSINDVAVVLDQYLHLGTFRMLTTCN